MERLGDTIRRLREAENLPLRTVAAYLDIDQAILSKIERGQRKASRDQVVKLARYFKVKENGLIIAWLSDKLVSAVEEEDMALDALQVAEGKLSYGKPINFDTTSVVKNLNSFFRKEKRISKAWLFGSVARSETTLSSDIDVMIEMNSGKKYTMLDILDIQFQLQQLFGRKVDVVEKGYLKPFAQKSIEGDLKLIIEK